MDEAFQLLFNAIIANKPNDRSGRDRAFAVLLTMLEQAYAYFILYISGIHEGNLDKG